MTYKAFDVVAVPFPFTDSSQTKKRPALVLSSHSEFGNPIGHSVMAMITSAKNAPWPLDIAISDLAKAGLSADSVIRMKIFTLDHRFVIKTLGSLRQDDRRAVMKAFSKLFLDIIFKS